MAGASFSSPAAPRPLHLARRAPPGRALRGPGCCRALCLERVHTRRQTATAHGHRRAD